jgi:catechol 2,3-dioxygenase-like lactoylglutathione lyase family enzyme
MTIHAQFSAVGLIAADMAKSLAFYRRLGLDIPADADSAPHAEVALPGGLRLMFDTEATIRSFHPDWTPPTGEGRIGLAFALPEPAAVDALHADLVAAGYRCELEPFDAAWGQRYATMLDPDGNGVDLFAPLPG